MAVAMRSSRLMSSMSKARRIWVQPFFRICVTANLIPSGIEARPDRLRIDENLAQGQGGREDLDEDCAHSAAIIGSLHST